MVGDAERLGGGGENADRAVVVELGAVGKLACHLDGERSAGEEDVGGLPIEGPPCGDGDEVADGVAGEVVLEGELV